MPALYLNLLFPEPTIRTEFWRMRDVEEACDMLAGFGGRERSLFVVGRIDR